MNSQQMDVSKSAKEFWISKTVYPQFEADENARRLVDAWNMFSFIRDCGSLVDLGCGTGSMLRLLREITDIKQFIGIDLNPEFIRTAIDKESQRPDKIGYICCDLAEEAKSIPTYVEAGISLGVIQYLDDDQLRNYLRLFRLRKFVLKSACSDTREDIIINKWSDSLKSNYASIYRSPDHIMCLLKEIYPTVDVHCPYIYPLPIGPHGYQADLDSKYNMSFRMFFCEDRK